MQNRQNSIPGYLYALDGFRAISVILIFMFHAWQQSWINLSIQLTQSFNLDFSFFQRYGFIAIDFFFVLSGFGLFYPIARSMFGESEFKGWKDFFIKRTRRIYPAYIITTILLVFIPSAVYVLYDKSNILQTIRNIITNFLFIENFTDKSVAPIVSTAWTLPIEVHFYMLFPLFCFFFRKKPVLTYLGMVAISMAVRTYFICFTDVRQFYQTLAIGYLDVFGAGMLCAYLVVYARHKMALKDKMKPFMTVISIISIYLISCFFKWMGNTSFPGGTDGAVYFRFLYRTILALFCGCFLFTACFSYDFWQKKIWGNRFFIFMSAISYTFYLWHQNIFIFLKTNHIPFTVSDPVTSDRVAMEGMVLICIAITIIGSVLITKYIEQPIARYGYKGYFQKAFSFLQDDRKNKKNRSS